MTIERLSAQGAALRRRAPSNRIRCPEGEELQQHHVHERAYRLVADREIETPRTSAARKGTGGSGFLSHSDPNEFRTEEVARGVA
jgi:hypothetical protein